MRPWVIWLLKRGMRWLVMALFIPAAFIQVGIWAVIGAIEEGRDAMRYLRSAWREIKEWKP